jgi:hypothetical protein
MLSVVNELKTKIASLESMIAAASGVVDGVTAATKKRGRPSKAALAAAAAAPPVPEKPKKEMSAGMKAWHDFNSRIDMLLKENEMPFKRVAEAKQFASKLKKEKPVADWTDEEILAEREEWAEDHKPVCPECKEDATDKPSDHRECIRNFADEFVKAGKGDSTKAIAEWTKLSGIAELLQTEEEPAEKKKPGRPKMTDEQKAAAKAARAAKKADTVTVVNEASVADEAPVVVSPAKPSKLGPTPGAPKKAEGPKIAWAETTKIREISDDLESVVSAE